MTGKTMILTTLAGALTLLAWEAISTVAIMWITQDVRDRSMIGLMLRQLALDILVAGVLLTLIHKLPRMTNAQYALGSGTAALAVSLATFGSNWNWNGAALGASLVNTLERVIAFTLLGLVLGTLYNRSSRVITDELRARRASGR